MTCGEAVHHGELMLQTGAQGGAGSDSPLQRPPPPPGCLSGDQALGSFKILATALATGWCSRRQPAGFPDGSRTERVSATSCSPLRLGLHRLQRSQRLPWRSACEPSARQAEPQHTASSEDGTAHPAGTECGPAAGQAGTCEPGECGHRCRAGQSRAVLLAGRCRRTSAPTRRPSRRCGACRESVRWR